LAKSKYRLHKREKELARMKKQEIKRQNKMDKKDTQSDTDETPAQIEEGSQ
jgi:hypothetical protein